MNQELKVQQFFHTIFNPGERTHFGTDIKETHVQDVEAISVTDTSYERFCINPLDPKKDRQPIQDYHAPDRPRRADCNVTVLRNVLVECDGIEIRDQLEYIRDSGLPYSTCCHSGGRSLHFIVSLVEPAKDMADYRDLVKRILSVLPMADQQNVNPSRTSRFPFHLREGVTEQTLIEIHKRVARDNLEAWLTDHGAPRGEPESIDHGHIRIHRHDDYRPTPSILSPWTKQLLLFGAPVGERNKRLFMAACDCFEKGFDADEVTDILTPVLDKLGSDFPEAEFRATIRSAAARAYAS